MMMMGNMGGSMGGGMNMGGMGSMGGGMNMGGMNGMSGMNGMNGMGSMNSMNMGGMNGMSGVDMSSMAGNMGGMGTQMGYMGGGLDINMLFTQLFGLAINVFSLLLIVGLIVGVVVFIKRYVWDANNMGSLIAPPAKQLPAAPATEVKE